MKTAEKIYCSLDIETTGFDPLTEEVLEVGLVFFEVRNSKFEILSQWTQVFKPGKEVEPKILGLTGIKPAELERAPQFSEFKDVIQEKIKDAIIVGHNIVFDIKFLEARGIKFSGKTIDTLDLVQWLLPTHHSYNLENLMHYFGIKHPDAHRALADAKATLEVLKKLLEIYGGFSPKLKKEIGGVLKDFGFEWKELLSVNSGATKLASPSKNPKAALKTTEKSDLKLEPRAIYNFAAGTDVLPALLPALAKSRKKYLLVVPKKQEAVRLWKEMGIEAIWESEQLFDQTRFKALLQKKLTAEEARFVLKILVWQSTNWQNKSLFDLNLSFFGGQFKQAVSGSKTAHDDKQKLLVCDIFTFLNCYEQQLFAGRQTVFIGLAEFEGAISLNLSDKVSWSQISYLLKSVYNPELNTGEIKHKETITGLLNAADLFFGLVSALFQTEPPTFLDIAITNEFRNSEKYNRVNQAAENFIAKLEEANKKLDMDFLVRTIKNLRAFFNDAPNRVKWLELSLNRCGFHNAPLLINDQAQKVFERYPESIFIDALAPKQAVSYFIGRLGIVNWPLHELKRPKSAKQDLFSQLKKLNCVIEASNPASQELLGLISKKDLPAAVLFGSPKSLKEFYETNYSELKSYSTLLSQIGSGGSNKLFNNFGINDNGLLFVTDRTVLKSLSGFVENSRPAKLGVKTLVILRLPFDPVSHPYAQALAATYPNAFEAMALPKALHNFHQLISFFHTPKLQNLYLFDSKLNKNYAKVFYEYVDQLKAGD